MCRSARLVFLMLVVALAWAGGEGVTAECPGHVPYRQSDTAPPYLTLRSSTQGRVRAVPVTPYAYGWFGATPRRQCVRHFGYYRDYTQWTVR